MKMINTRERQPTKAGVYECVVMVGRGDNARAIERLVEFMIRGGKPWWQIEAGSIVEYWGER